MGEGSLPGHWGRRTSGTEINIELQAAQCFLIVTVVVLGITGWNCLCKSGQYGSFLSWNNELLFMKGIELFNINGAFQNSKFGASDG